VLRAVREQSTTAAQDWSSCIRDQTCLAPPREATLNSGAAARSSTRRSVLLLASTVLCALRPPRLVLVREPDLLRVERADQPLAFGARLVQLGEEDRRVAADDD